MSNQVFTSIASGQSGEPVQRSHAGDVSSSSNNSSANSGVSIKVHSGDGYARAEAGHADQGSIFSSGGVRPGIGGGQVGQVHSIEIGGDGRSVQTQSASVQRYEGNGASDNAGIKITSQFGTPRDLSSARPDDIVTLPGGMQTSVAAARAAGLLSAADLSASARLGRGHGNSNQEQRPFDAAGKVNEFDTKPQ